MRQVYFRRMIMTDSHPAIHPADLQKLFFLKGWLDIHYLEKLSLPDLARRCLLNEFKLKKGFRQAYGTTVFGYIRQLRMDHASQLLRTGCPVTEAAFALGYEHPQHFSTAYKKYTGYQPFRVSVVPSSG